VTTLWRQFLISENLGNFPHHAPSKERREAALGAAGRHENGPKIAEHARSGL